MLPLPLPPAGTYANPALKQGEFKAALEQELAAVRALQHVPSGGGIASTAPAAIAAAALGLAFVRGADGRNNVATPDTQYDLTAAAVQLWRPSDANVVVRVNPGTLTNNVLTAGPVANGRDQAAAFSASSFVHLYWIWNGTTLATLSSASPPPTGPTLPAGYTHWAYATTVRFNASSQLLRSYLKGAWHRYEAAIAGGSVALVSSGTATAETVISTALLIPSLALEFAVRLAASAQHTATGSTNVQLFLRAGVWSRTMYVGMWVANLNITAEGGEAVLPNTGYLAYSWGSGYPATTRNFFMDAAGYKVPNGGE